jgi:hypothetical protein
MTDRDSQDRLMRMCRDADWDDITPRLELYAYAKLGKYHREKGRNGWSRDKFVSEGVDDVLQGRYVPDLDESLVTNLMKAIGRLIELDAAGRL